MIVVGRSKPIDYMDQPFVQKITQIRNSVSKSLQPRAPANKGGPFGEPREDDHEGWSLSAINPAIALKYLPNLHLRKGWKLVGYQFKCDGNGNGVVHAIPESNGFDLSSCLSENKEVVPGVVLATPRPSGSAESFMEAIEPDGSLEAYLQASILFRELNEFGAMWHGCSWSTHTILLSDPWSPKSKLKGRDEISEQIHWTFEAAKPECWEPSVKQEGKIVTVSFFTCSSLGAETIYLYRDRYQSPCMTPEVEEQVIATGPDGFVF
jgi:hypothetical protein